MNLIPLKKNSKKTLFGDTFKILPMRNLRLNKILPFCLMCIGHVVIGSMFLTLGWAFAMMFCHFFGLPVNWATQWIP